MTTKATKTQNIESTTFSMEANVIALDSIPSIKEQDLLFENGDSVVLEF